MNSREFHLALPVIVCLALIFATVAGCSRNYRHQHLSLHGTRAGEIEQMVAVLQRGGRSAVDDAMRKYKKQALSPPRRTRLQASLLTLAQTPNVRLAAIDRFGSKIFRTTFTFPRTHHPPLTMLLILKGGKLQWAGPN